MSTTIKPLTIAERIRTALSADPENGTLDATGGCYKPLLPHDGTYLTTYELDLLDWGLTYGMAFALARMEEPWERDASVAERALQEARAAYDGWGGGVGGIKRPKVMLDIARHEADEGEEPE